MLTLAMPQSEPVAGEKCFGSRRFIVKIAEESPCGTSLWSAIASSNSLYLRI